jgi:hypothetical protein
MIIAFLKEISFATLMWIIPIVFFLHEMEEWNILNWYHATYNPPPKSTKLSCRIWLFIISIWAFILSALAYVIPEKHISAGIVIFLVVFTTFNGLQHIYWTISFKKYAPGVIFSSLGIICGATVTATALQQELVSSIYVIALYILTIPFLIMTFKAKNTLIKPFEQLHNLTLKIVEFLEN